MLINESKYCFLKVQILPYCSERIKFSNEDSNKLKINDLKINICNSNSPGEGWSNLRTNLVSAAIHVSP